MREGIAKDDMVFAVTLDMRYQGQAYELNVPFSAAAIDEFHKLPTKRLMVMRCAIVGWRSSTYERVEAASSTSRNSKLAN